MTVPKTWTKFADDVLVDPIKLIEPEGTKVHFESCDLSGTEIIDYGYKVEIQESDFQDSTVQLPLREQPSEILPHKRNIVKRSLSVKLVDCKTYPWYYKKYKRQLYNIAATIDLSATNENIQEAISLVKEDSPNNGEPLKTFTYITSSKDPKEVKKRNDANSEYCLDLIKQKALKQKGCIKIDFKRNKGLIGLTIKRNVRLEKLKRGNVLAENTSNVIGAKVDDNEKMDSIDDVVCEYVIEHDTVTIKNNIENDITSIKPKSIALNEKPKSSLSPGSYKLSHLTTGEKVITLVKSLKHSFDPNKSALSPTSVPTVIQSEKLSKITKNCKRRSNKKPGPKSKLIKNKTENAKEKLDITQTLQKTIEKLLNKPMPKSRKLQLQKQRRENERKTKKYLKNIPKKVISRQAIIIGSRVSAPSQKASDTKSSVESNTSNSTPTLKKLLGSDTLINRNYCDSDSLNIASFQKNEILNNNICVRPTSPKMSSDSKIESVNSNSCITVLAKSCSDSSKNVDSESQTNLSLVPTPINNESANVSSQKQKDKMCLATKNISVDDNSKSVKALNTLSLKSVDKLGPESLSNPCAKSQSYNYSQMSSNLVTDGNNHLFSKPGINLQLADNFSNKLSEKSDSNISKKMSDASSVKPNPVSTYDSRCFTSNNLQLESSNNLHSNSKSMNPNVDIGPIPTENIYSQSYTSSMCNDKLIYTLSNISNAPSSLSAPNDLKHKSVTLSNPVKNIETESVCNIEHEIKSEPLDLVVGLENNTAKEHESQNNQRNVPQNNRSDIATQNNRINTKPQNNRSDSVVQNNQSNVVAQNNRTNSMPQNNQQNTAQDNKHIHKHNFKNTLPKPFPSHDTTSNVVDKPPYSVSASARKPYIVRIRNPIPMERPMRFDNVVNRLNQYQGHQLNSWNSRFDNQKPIFQEPLHPNMFRQPPPLLPEPHNNLNNFYFGDHYRMPANPGGPKYVPRGMNMNWPQPDYYCNNSGLWNYESNYAIQPNNPIVGNYQEGFVRKINIRPNFPTVPTRKDTPKMPVENSKAGKSLVSVSLKQNVAIGPRTNEPVKTRSEMLQELDSVIANNLALNNLTPANNLHKTSSIPVQISGPIPTSPSVKHNTLIQKSNVNNLSDCQKTQDYSPPILPIPSYENMLSKTSLSKKTDNCVQKSKESKQKQVSKPRTPNKRSLGEEINKPKISIDEYKRRACS